MRINGPLSSDRVAWNHSLIDIRAIQNDKNHIWSDDARQNPTRGNDKFVKYMLQHYVTAIDFIGI